jgi:hypothetical protein
VTWRSLPCEYHQAWPDPRYSIRRATSVAARPPNRRRWVRIGKVGGGSAWGPRLCYRGKCGSGDIGAAAERLISSALYWTGGVCTADEHPMAPWFSFDNSVSVSVFMRVALMIDDADRMTGRLTFRFWIQVCLILGFDRESRFWTPESSSYLGLSHLRVLGVDRKCSVSPVSRRDLES